MKEQIMMTSEHSSLFEWKYDISWAAVEEKAFKISKEEAEAIKKQLEDFCKNQDTEVVSCKIEDDCINIAIQSVTQLNLGKFLKGLQKSFISKMDLSKAECMIISKNEDINEKDLRVEGILRNLWSGDYYDLDEGLDDKDLDKLSEYLRDRNLGVIDLKGQLYLIDIKGLSQQINLNCFACTKKYQYGCCCGAPCGFSEKNMECFDKHLLQMEEAVKAIDEGQYNRLQANGGFITANGKLKSFDGHCSLLIEEGGAYKCMVHKYALDNSIPPYEICPLSCLMYPLEIIELVTNKKKKVILLTSVIEESFAKDFGRWGSYESLETDMACINKAKHNEIFKKEDYKPVYEVAERLLTYEFGKQLYDGIKKLI